MKGYTAVLIILIGVLIGMLFLRSDVEALVLRLPGQLYELKENSRVSNVYTYKLINKTTLEYHNIEFKLLSHKGDINFVTQAEVVVPPQGLVEGTLFIEVPQAALDGHKTKMEIGVYSDGKLIETTRTNFLGPRSFR